MPADTPALLIDDGELESVRDLLDHLGADYERLTRATARIPVRQPATLLVTTAALAHALRMQRAITTHVPRATWIAFVASDSRTQRAALQKAGFDFLVREPIHPAALQVLLKRALFRGADARRAPRVACGHPVTYRTGFWRRNAMLVDLSPRGCRLLTPRPLKDRSEVSIQIPRGLADGRVLELVGHVVRVAPSESELGREGESIVGVRFAPLEDGTRDRLRTVLAERILGPAVLASPISSRPLAAPPAPRAAASTSPAAGPVEAASQRRDKRRSERAHFEKKITAMEGEHAYMLLCRDLSAGGVRIEPVEGLKVGDRLDLAIQASPREEPFLVESSVVRDDGELGLALRFDWIAPESQQRLQALIATLPSIEPLQEDAGRQGTILAQRMPPKTRG